MIRNDDICYLIAEDPGAHGVFDAVALSPRRVYCTVRSVGMREAYSARDHGLAPSVVVVLSDAMDYRGEKIVVWRGRGYAVDRVYVTEDNRCEITLEEVTVDAATLARCP